MSILPARGAFARLLAILLIASMAAACSTSQTLTTVSPQPSVSDTRYAAYVVDASNGRVLHDEFGSERRYPASLTKMMTVYMLLEAIESGRVSASDAIPISAFAAARPPSKLGFRPGETISVDTAIRALLVKSANDVAVAVAEHLSGSEEAFAAAMTARARSIGMGSTTFRNASGLPDPGQVTTARDMALLGLSLRKRFPGQMHYFAQTSFSDRGRTIRGHNRLIGSVAGVDGMKTGYIRASGFNVVTSVSRGGRRLMVVVMGGTSADARNERARELIELHAGSRVGWNRLPGL